MPDRDIFQFTIDSGWKSVARRMFKPEIDERDLGTAIVAAARDFRAFGCPGLDQEILMELTAEISPAHFRQQIQDISCSPDSIVSPSLLEGATLVAIDARVQPDGWEQLTSPGFAKKLIAKYTVIEHITSKCMPQKLLIKLEHQGYDNTFIHECNERLRARLNDDSRLDKLAEQLLADPAGSNITRPENPRTVPDHEEMLAWNLN